MSAAIRHGVDGRGVDIVIPSAGVFPGSMPARAVRDAWRRTMAVNTDAVAELFTQVHPLLKLSRAVAGWS